MKPPKLRNPWVIRLLGMVLAAAALALVLTAQVGPQLPGTTTPAPRPPGAAGLACGQNRLTTLEQLQNGSTISEIQQREARAVACKVNPAVVEIVASGFGAVPGQEYETISAATPGPLRGSGVIVSADGDIITNLHVIKNAPKLRVFLHQDGKPDEQLPAELKGQDPNTDLALLKIVKTDLPFLEFNFQTVRQGDTVYAFGSPHGVGISQTKGIISAPVRQVEESDKVDYIQTDAAINSGNSGGALVDINGKLVGINSFILTSSGGNEGLNFAVPAGTVSYVYGQLKQFGYVTRGTIGITTRNLNPELIRAFKIPVQVGVYVEDVDPKGPADNAGIHIGDIVVGYESSRLGRTTDASLELSRALSQYVTAHSIRLDILRDGNPKTFTVVVNQQSPATSANTVQLSSDLIVPQLGVYVVPMNIAIAAPHNLRNPQGLLVLAKVQSMTASSTELQIDDLIWAVNDAKVMTQEDLQDAIDNAESGSTLFLQIERGRRNLMIPITIN